MNVIIRPISAASYSNFYSEIKCKYISLILRCEACYSFIQRMFEALRNACEHGEERANPASHKGLEIYEEVTET